MLQKAFACICKIEKPLLFLKRLSSGKVIGYSSPFADDEVYNVHHEDLDLRNGPEIIPGNRADFLIVGGGIMGQSLAYHLWRNMERKTAIKASKYVGTCGLAIVEKNPTLHDSATALAVGGIRTQFSHPANIKLSIESAEFIRNIKYNLSTVRNPEPDVHLNSQGYLTLATNTGAEQLMKNFNTQTEAGAKIMLFTNNQLKETFPWLNVEGIELAAYGLENEGWFDPMSLVDAFKSKNSSFPIDNINGEVVGFRKEIFDTPQPAYAPEDVTIDSVTERLQGVYIKTKEHDKPHFIKCHCIFNCAGAMSAKIAELAGIGVEGDLSHPILKQKLPVEPRKRFVYVVHCPDAPMLDLPFVIDPSGVYVRREGFGGKYVCGMSPSEDQEPSTDNLDVDYDFFESEVWPRLAHRIPAFEKLKLVSAWAGFYDYNTFDQNAIIGRHPYYYNFLFMTGFSGHGIQQACAAGKKLADLVITGGNETDYSRDLARFSFDRIIENRPLVEQNII